MIRKVLVANRGEIALRVVRACRELGIKTLAVYSEADEQSLPVQLADEAICIGPSQAAQSYLKADRIISAAELGRLRLPSHHKMRMLRSQHRIILMRSTMKKRLPIPLRFLTTYLISFSVDNFS